MSKGVHISSRVFAALCGALVLTLLALGFLLGRRSTPPTAVPPTPLATPPPLAVAQPPAKPSLSERLDALDRRVNNIGQKTIGQALATQSPGPIPQAQTPPVATASAKTTGDYLRQVDAIVGGSAAIADPRPFATRLLEQGMSGDGHQLDSVLARTSQAKAELLVIEPPAQCQEHHRLLLGQLSIGQDLLTEVKAAHSTGDTGRLANLAAGGETSPADTLRLQEIDRSLRQPLVR